MTTTTTLSLYVAWSAVLTTLAEAIGVDVEVERCRNGESRDTSHDDDGEIFEVTLWQTAHDHVHRSDAGVWSARPVDRSLIDGLRSMASRCGVLTEDGEAKLAAYRDRNSTG